MEKVIIKAKKNYIYCLLVSLTIFLILTLNLKNVLAEKYWADESGTNFYYYAEGYGSKSSDYPATKTIREYTGYVGTVKRNDDRSPFAYQGKYLQEYIGVIGTDVTALEVKQFSYTLKSIASNLDAYPASIYIDGNTGGGKGGYIQRPMTSSAVKPSGDDNNPYKVTYTGTIYNVDPSTYSSDKIYGIKYEKVGMAVAPPEETKYDDGTYSGYIKRRTGSQNAKNADGVVANKIAWYGGYVCKDSNSSCQEDPTPPTGGGDTGGGDTGGGDTGGGDDGAFPGEGDSEGGGTTGGGSDQTITTSPDGDSVPHVPVTEPEGGFKLNLTKLLGLDPSKGEFGIRGNDDGSLTFMNVYGNLASGAYSTSSNKSEVTDPNGNAIDTVIVKTSNRLITQVTTILSYLLALSIIILIGATVVTLIKLGGSSDNQGKREDALHSLGWLAASFAIIGSVGLIFALIIGLFK